MNTNNININVKRFTETILEAAKQSIPRGRRKDYKPYWSEKLQQSHSKLSQAREQLEKEPTPERTAAYSKARELYDGEKARETRRAWQEKWSL